MKNIALITGASKGIGKALAEVFAENGYSLILIARTTKILEELQLSLKTKYQCQVKIISADLSLAQSMDDIMEAIQEDLDHITVLINNAGFGIAKKLTDIPENDVTGMIALNITALTRLTYHILPSMVAKKRGKILNVASTAAFGPGPYLAIYYATKSYVLHFSEGIHEEYRDDGISVSVLCPGVTQTEFQKRAGMEDLLISSGRLLTIMSAKEVATKAYRGLMKDKRVIIPGLMNKMMRFMMWVSPHWLIAKITGSLQKPKN